MQTPKTITIRAGTAKDGTPEPVRALDVSAGEIVALVGPTGSGKSRLLADIEWLAARDSPTGRRVLVDGRERDAFEGEISDVVARLTQNMMYQLDLSVGEFLGEYAEERGVSGAADAAFEWANRLAGEPFGRDVPLAMLSGGQARALMIAEIAFLSGAAVVLIDEIENAGINRIDAVELLSGAGKITLIATHDPLLSLMASRRVVFANGAMTVLRETSPRERALLEKLREDEQCNQTLRERLRGGDPLEGILRDS